MLIHVHALGITPERSPLRLRTDKKPKPLACRSRLPGPDVAAKASSLCDALSQPTSKAVESGCLTN